IQNDDFYYEVEESETKLIKETLYELFEDDEKKKLGKNNEAKMTLYNALPHKEYERVFMCKTAKEVWHTLIITHQGNSQVKNCKIDLLTQEFKKFSIFNEETIDSVFTRFNAIVTSLKSLDPDYSSKNHLIVNLKVYEMVLDNDGVGSKTTKEKVKSLALKAKVTRDKTSDDSDSQGGCNEDINEEKDKAINLLARNFCKGNRFGRGNQFGNDGNRFGKGRGNSFGNKGGERSKQKGDCYSCGIAGHFASEYRKPKENKAFVGGTLNDRDGDEHQNDATCLMAIDS
ncbi:zf-CCHC domain-containing protein, partial [Tanacetum coccineum]